MDAVRDYELAERRLLDRYSISASSRYIELPDPRLRARILEVGTGTPVLFVHGGGGAAMNWIPLLAQLRGIRAIAIDRPGHGLSDPFDYRGVDLRRHAVTFLNSVIDSLGLDCVPIVANSMGGLWSLWAALDVPARVSSLALLGCPAFLLDTGAPAPMRLLSVPYLNRLLMKAQPASAKGARQMWTMMRADVAALPRELIEATAAVLQIPSTAVAWRTLLENTLRLRGPLPYAFSENDLRRVRQRTLFLWGTRDPFGAPAVGRRAVALMPDARIEVLDEGHLPWLDDPAPAGRFVSAHLQAVSRELTPLATASDVVRV
jgi:pimeloyl-ACP methyl ester carboxylesterase